MINKLQLEIDICVASDRYLQRFNTFMSNTEGIDIQFINNPTKGYLLIIEFDMLQAHKIILAELLEKYEHVIIITSQVDAEFLHKLYEQGVSAILRDDFLVKELEIIVGGFVCQKKTHIQSELLNAIFEKAQNSIVITNKKGDIEYANQYFQALTGFSLDELIEHSPKAIKSEFHPPIFYKDLWDHIQSGQVWDGIFVNLNRSGELFYEESTITPILNDRNQITKYLKIGKNVTRERMLVNELTEEVEIAQRVMKNIIPETYSDSNLHFQCELVAYNYLGGDFIHFYRKSDTLYELAFIDIMGHGVATTLMGITVGTTFRNYSHFYSLEQTIHELNNEIIKINEGNNDKHRYATGIFIEIDFGLSHIKIINAGHPDLCIVHKSGDVSTFQSNNVLLGVLADHNFTSRCIPLEDISMLFLYSDGLVDTKLEEYESDFHRLKSVLKKLRDCDDSSYFKSILKDMVDPYAVSDDVAMCKVRFND